MNLAPADSAASSATPVNSSPPPVTSNSNNISCDSPSTTEQTVTDTTHSDILNAILADASAVSTDHQANDIPTQDSQKVGASGCGPSQETAGLNLRGGGTERRGGGRRWRKQPWVSRRENKRRKVGVGFS